jgi:hypothetical protein
MTTEIDPREIDAKILEHIFEYEVMKVKPSWYDREVTLFRKNGYNHYSFDTNACNACMSRNGKDDKDGVADPLPHYSSEDMEEVWEVIREITKDENLWFTFTGSKDDWRASFGKFPTKKNENPALAICLAALATKSL